MHPAGRRYHYSNPGFALLGALVARLRGAPWGEALRREVLEPLGMARTTPAPRAPHAAGWAVHPWADVLLPEPAEDTGLMAPGRAAVVDRRRPGPVRRASCSDGDDRVLRAGDARRDARARRAARRRRTGTAATGWACSSPAATAAVWPGTPAPCPASWPPLWVSPDDGAGRVALANATSGPRRRASPPTCWASSPSTSRGSPRLAAAAEADPALLALTGPWYWGPAPYVLRLRADGGLELAPAERAGAAPGSRAEPATAPGPASTATTPARRCGVVAARTARSAISTSAPSSSPGSPTTRRRGARRRRPGGLAGRLTL